MTKINNTVKNLSLIILISFVIQILLFILSIEYFSSNNVYIKIVPTNSNVEFSFGYTVAEMFENYALSKNIISKLAIILQTGSFWIVTIFTIILLSAFWVAVKYFYKKVKSNAL